MQIASSAAPLYGDPNTRKLLESLPYASIFIRQRQQQQNKGKRDTEQAGERNAAAFQTFAYTSNFLSFPLFKRRRSHNVT